MTTIKMTKTQMYTFLGIEDTKDEMKIESMTIHLPHNPKDHKYIINYELKEIETIVVTS